MKLDYVRMDPTWTGRRRAVACTLLACLGLAVRSMELGTEMAAIVFPTVGTVVSAALALYVGGAVYERSKGISSLSARPQDVDFN
jgi:hypothetical protein